MRQFGPYGVQTLRELSWLRGTSGFNCYLYYRTNWHDEIIAGPAFFTTESECLAWAKGEIKKHKAEMDELRDLTRE
jgi:hypothetical protein